MWVYETCDEYVEFNSYDEAIHFCKQYDLDINNLYNL